MSTPDIAEQERTLLVDYVRSGKLMQLATLDHSGAPALCHVWYRPAFEPDRLWFISRHDRAHSANLRSNPTVAGGIVAIPLDGLGQTVRGVTYTGSATELPTTGIDAEIAGFIERWPNAAGPIAPDTLARNETPTRLYQINVQSWVLFDEQHFPADPRRTIPAA